MPRKKTTDSAALPVSATGFTENDRLIVIGASTGGVSALVQLLSSLPADFDTPIFIVWHMPADGIGVLPRLLNSCGKMYAANGINNETIQKNRIYTAPPDHHMLLENGVIKITKGPKENRFRPAIDPLFRSAAFEYGSRVIGIILSGGLDDGTAGLWAVKEFGGTAIIQDPAEAEVPSMPEHALNAVKADHVAGVKEMGKLLMLLTASFLKERKEMPPNSDRIKDEINVVLQKDGHGSLGLTIFGEATQYACPECHGVLSAITEGNRVRYRCHTGHAFSAESLFADMSEKVEADLWNALRGIGETILLLNRQGDRLAAMNKPKEAAVFFRQAIEAKERMEIINGLLKRNDGAEDKKGE